MYGYFLSVMERQEYACKVCGKRFNREDNLRAHEQKHDAFQCPNCPEAFATLNNLKVHQARKHDQTGGGRKRRSESPQPGPSKKTRAKEDPMDLYTITPTGEQRMAKFNTTARYYRVNIKNLEVTTLPKILKTLRSLFASIILQLTSK